MINPCFRFRRVLARASLVALLSASPLLLTLAPATAADPPPAHADTAQTYLEQGNARYAAGDWQGAIDSYNRAIELAPDSANIYYNRGNVRARQDDWQAAITDYDRAITLNADYAEAYGNRGIAHANLGDKQGATQDLQKAAELFQAQGQTESYQRVRDLLNQLQ